MVLEFSDKLRKEIRGCAVLRAWEMINHGNSCKRPVQAQKMFELVHGTETIFGQLQQLVQGNGLYESMFEQKVGIVTNSSTTDARTLVLSSTFQLNKEYVLGKDFDLRMLEKLNTNPKSELVGGRNLIDFATESMKNIRKALTELEQMQEVVSLDSDGVTTKSGISEDEVKVKLLDRMYELEKEKNMIKKEEPRDNLTDNNTKENDGLYSIDNKRPDGWFFKGWMPFCLFGPFVPESRRITLIETGSMEDDKKKEFGRKESRKRERRENDVARSNDQGNQRGLSVSNKIAMDALELQAKTMKHRKNDTKIIALLGEIRSVEVQLARADSRVKQFCPNEQPNSENPLWKKVFDLEKKSEDLSSQLAVLRSAIDSPEQKKMKLTSSDELQQPPVNEVTVGGGSNSSPSYLLSPSVSKNLM